MADELRAARDGRKSQAERLAIAAPVTAGSGASMVETAHGVSGNATVTRPVAW